VTPAFFDGTARVASGSLPTAAVTAYRVSVARGHLRLTTVTAVGTVLDVPLDRVRARPSGRAGAVVLEVDDSPILVDFTHRDPYPAGGVAGTARRVGPALRGRWVRRRFLSAARPAGR
jgi:hypothetical protein